MIYHDHGKAGFEQLNLYGQIYPQEGTKHTEFSEF